MTPLLHLCIEKHSRLHPKREALLFRDRAGEQCYDYRQLWCRAGVFAHQLQDLSLAKGDRLALYLGKTPETVVAIIACLLRGIIFVPINPQLKIDQVGHILRDSGARALLSNRQRLTPLNPLLNSSSKALPNLHTLICIDPDDTTAGANATELRRHPFSASADTSAREIAENSVPLTGNDHAAILYTSGSTGLAKGVVLSQANLFHGAQSVSHYLGNRPSDRLLAVLPLSFDYGLSQLTTAFYSGASVVLIDYLLPRDLLLACAHYRITGLAAVPPLWQQLSRLSWPELAVTSLRYFTNSGGALAPETLTQLRQRLPHSQPFLMYGLTEAFRSSFLDPAEIEHRPTSMGKAIPGAELHVVRRDGSLCDVDEVGELIHLGPLVSQGYWGDATRTARHFRRWPDPVKGAMAVWSGDQVRRDAEGFLYFVGRRDEMIKTSGYRVSPGEIEHCLASCPGVGAVVAFGVPDAKLGQAIIACVEVDRVKIQADVLARHCQRGLANYMQPRQIVCQRSIPRNANGKLDRSGLKQHFIATQRVDSKT